MKKMGSLLLVSMLLLSSGLAQTSQELWTSASEQYANGEYENALVNYQGVEQSVISSELFYNLGNCYYQLDSVASAILYFEKAIKLNPRDRKARENLALAVERMEDPIPSIDAFFLTRWVSGVSEFLPSIAWGLISLVFLWTALFMVASAVKRNTLRANQIRYILPAGAFVFTLMLGYVALQNQTNSDYAIVMKSIDVRVAPDALSAITKSVREGEKVMILDNLDAFYKVRFVNYEHGWIPKSVVKGI